MRIDRLRLVNFRQHADTELVLGAGLTGIIGPNGAGKTTLLEAIAWALYGMPAARGSRETIRRRSAEGRAQVRVELDFTLGPHHFRVERGLNQASLYQDADPSPVANSLQAVTEKVSRLLGMTREEFFNTYFTGQKELAVMAAMSPGERAQFLSRVLGYERLRTAQDRLKEQRGALRGRVQALESSLPDPGELDAEEREATKRHDAAYAAEAAALDQKTIADRRATETGPRWESMQRLREQSVALEGDLKLADHKVSAARERFQALDRQLVEALGAQEKLQGLRGRLEPLRALRVERDTLERLAEGVAARERFAAQVEELTRAIQSLDARAAKLPAAEGLDAERARVDQARGAQLEAAGRAEEIRTAWTRDLQDARTKHQALREQFGELKEQHRMLERAGPDGVCPTCARPLGQEFASVVGLLARQMEEVRANGLFYKQRVEQLSAEPADLKEADRRRTQLEQEANDASARLALLQAQAQEAVGLRQERGRLEARLEEAQRSLKAAPAAYDQPRHHEVKRLMAELEPLALQAERLIAASERGPTLVKEAESAERDLSALESEAKALRDRASALGFGEQAYQEARMAHESVERERRQLEVSLARTRAEAQAAGETRRGVARRREERARREQEVLAGKRDLALNTELDRALADLRTDLNATLRPDLSDLASGFLRDLTNGRYTELELDENYEATLLDEGEPKRVISGGEEDVSNLALRLAISQMIAERAGQPLSLLVLDEIFGSLDEERRAAVVDLLRSLADRFPQVILITHIESVRDGFDRVLRVNYDVAEGMAVVREDTPDAALALAGGGDGLAA